MPELVSYATARNGRRAGPRGGRRVRHGGLRRLQRWFVGAVLPGVARTVSVPTSFLGGSGNWLVETITDGSADLTRSSRTVTAGTALSVAIAANGGFAMQICPATAGRTTCDI